MARVCFVCKRFPQQRDLISRPYGRFHFLPVGLASLGHDVRVMLVSHRGLESEEFRSEGVEWSSDDLRRLGPLGLERKLMARARAFAPDWVVGVSDAQFGWLASRVSRQLGARLAVDAYDDYESYMPWNLPLHWLWRRSLRRAELVTAAGPQLARLLQSHRSPSQSTVEMLPMAADPGFSPRDKQQCRASLGLPANTALVGYLGSWGPQRGTRVLLEALGLLRQVRNDLHLVVAGNAPRDVISCEGVLGLGYLPDADMPSLLSALDVACVITANSRFGRSSYPAKLYEAMACAVPVVATATDPVKWILSDDARHLTPPGMARQLAERVLARLEDGQADYAPNPPWPELARVFSGLLARPRPMRS